MLGFARGFDLGFKGIPNNPLEVTNQSSTNKDPSVVTKKLEKEISTGRIAGPFAKPFKLKTERAVHVGGSLGKKAKLLRINSNVKETILLHKN